MSTANETKLRSLIGLCVGYRPGKDRGKTLWVDVVDAAPKLAGRGFFLRVAHKCLGRETWIDGASAIPRCQRDAEIMDEAHKEQS